MAEKFNIIKKGYDPSEVDKYIDEIETVLRSYKEKDAAIKNALISAQIMADSIVENAEKNAAEIHDEAVRFLDSVLESVALHRNYISSFEQEYSEMLQKYTRLYNENDTVRLLSDAGGIESYISGVKTSILENTYGEKESSDL